MANLLTGLGIDQLFTRTDGAGTSEIFTDALGSTVALADTSGTVQTSYTYEPFGGTTQSGNANSNSYKFTGREDDGTGLLYYRARYYSPRLQRFISEDPIGFRGRQANLYGYVRNAPTIYIDPYGLIEGQIGPNIPKIPYRQEPIQNPDSCLVSPPDPLNDAINREIRYINSLTQEVNQMKRYDFGGPKGDVILNVFDYNETVYGATSPPLDQNIGGGGLPGWGIGFQVPFR